MERSAVLDLLVERSEAVRDLADSSCTAGYNNDGSTGFEIFTNGFHLAKQANGAKVFYGVAEADHVGYTAYFFIGEYSDILTKIDLVCPTRRELQKEMR